MFSFFKLTPKPNQTKPNQTKPNLGRPQPPNERHRQHRWTGIGSSGKKLYGPRWEIPFQILTTVDESLQEGLSRGRGYILGPCQDIKMSCSTQQILGIASLQRYAMRFNAFSSQYLDLAEHDKKTNLCCCDKISLSSSSYPSGRHNDTMSLVFAKFAVMQSLAIACSILHLKSTVSK